MLNLDKHRIYITCERCSFEARPFLRQVRQGETIIPTAAQEGGVPFITHNNKTIFFLVIDIFDHPDPASKRGQLRPYDLATDQLVAALA